MSLDEKQDRERERGWGRMRECGSNAEVIICHANKVHFEFGGKNESQRGLNSEYLIEWRCLRGMYCLKCFVLFFVSSAFQNPHLIPAQEGSWEGRTRRRDDSRRVWGGSRCGSVLRVGSHQSGRSGSDPKLVALRGKHVTGFNST